MGERKELRRALRVAAFKLEVIERKLDDYLITERVAEERALVITAGLRQYVFARRRARA